MPLISKKVETVDEFFIRQSQERRKEYDAAKEQAMLDMQDEDLRDEFEEQMFLERYNNFVY